MKKQLFCWILACVLSFQTKAQDWPGFDSGNFAGINRARIQPASLVGSPFQYDINILGLGVALYGENAIPNYNVFKNLGGGKLMDYVSLLRVTSNELLIKGHFLFPSLLYSINDNNAVGFSWGIRALSLNTTSETALKNLFSGSFKQEDTDQYSNEFFRVYLLSWSEFNFTYSRMIYKNDQHLLKGGATFKLLQGMGSLTGEIGNIDFEVQGDTLLTDVSLSTRYIYDKKIQNIMDGEGFDIFGNTGFAFDAGLEYEYGQTGREQDFAQYLFKIGFTIGGLGSMGFSAEDSKLYTGYAANVSVEKFENISSFLEWIDTLNNTFEGSKSNITDRYRVRLPVTIGTQLDYNFGKNFFVNLSWQMNLNRLGFNESPIPNSYRIRVVPRYEDLRFGVYLPLDIGNMGVVNAGLGLRWKAFAIGSSNIFSRWFYTDKVIGDLYVTIKAPVLREQYQKHRPVQRRQGR